MSMVDCKKLAPIWEQLADSLQTQKDKITIAKVNADGIDTLSNCFILTSVARGRRRRLKRWRVLTRTQEPQHAIRHPRVSDAEVL